VHPNERPMRRIVCRRHGTAQSEIGNPECVNRNAQTGMLIPDCSLKPVQPLALLKVF
jgi:hypothetical protein